MIQGDPHRSMANFNPEDHAGQLTALEQLARSALARYPIAADCGIRLLNLSENAMFKVEDAAGNRWVLRVHREGYHTPEAIASELAWAMALRNEQVVITPSPVAGHDGRFVQQLSNPGLATARHVVLFHWEPGAEPAITDDLFSHVATLGEITARMHLHARQWRWPAGFTRHRWDFSASLGEEQPRWGRWRDAVGLTKEAELLFERTVQVIGRRLTAYGSSPDRFGLIHADLRLANLLIDGETVKVIDFDDCGFGWFMYDAASVISFYEHEARAQDLIEGWKLGYRRVMPIDPADEAEIPTFVMFRRILLTAWIASHFEADFPRSLGASYTASGLDLCENYLRVHDNFLTS
ncbi:phosphotransferase enzyme family protein [Aestuariivirga sp.]|uniref:phosphotransferase enzyme family protein n=1 Tax=Aestuariivirga sp. TaxID=2650926 RepID=UPI00378426C5